MKTASTSMEIALSQILGPDDILTPARHDLDLLRRCGPGGQNCHVDHPDKPKIPLWRKILRRPERYFHPTVGYYEHMPAWRVRRYLGDEIWNSYYKFAFERNPWDRQISFYHYKTRNLEQPKIPSFEKFLAKGKRVQVSNWSNYTIDDEVVLDFIGQYENLEEDFETAMTAIGMARQISLPTTNVAKIRCDSRSYQEYYTNSTRELVARWSAGEIKYFGYTF